MNSSVEKPENNLFTEYNWYQNTFSSVIQEASDNFFTKYFCAEFIGLSKNINCLLNGEACFVTKVKIENDYDMFFRLTEKTIELILDKVLGKAKTRFNINKISELEAKIITAFNAFMYKSLKDKLKEPNPKELKRSNFDMVNLTFFIKDIDPEIKTVGKVIVTIPEVLLEPEQVTSSGDKFSKDDFWISEVIPTIRVGKTRFSLYEVKNLEVNDVVVFEESNLEKLRFFLLGEEMVLNLSPNMDLTISQEADDMGGDNMAKAHNLWDSIEVDMIGEFDSVKISLGDLKKIEEGLVMDLASLYENKVTLKVENKAIAEGSLVIVNDRYGVKIDKVFAKKDGSSVTETVQETDDVTPVSEEQEVSNPGYSAEAEEHTNNVEQAEGDEEDFDYSDFELEDESL